MSGIGTDSRNALGSGVAQLGDLPLESGQILPRAQVAYRSWGRLNASGTNAVLVLHALTGDQHAGGSGGWWEKLIGPGRALDTERCFVLCPAILGGCSGSTGPASPAEDSRPWGSRFPRLSIRDTVTAEAMLAEQLGIRRFALVAGGSLGGARAAEWAVSRPGLVARCAVIAANAALTAQQLGWCRTQELAIRQDPHFAGGDYYGGPGPQQGLGLARQIAHLTYRSEAELERRFGRELQEAAGTGPGHRPVPFQIESYLAHQGCKLAARFDANAYLTVNGILASHDLGRGRGGVRAALARTRCAWILAAVETDQLFLPEQMHLFSRALPEPVPVHTLRSSCGHDGFLLETDQLAPILSSALSAPGHGRPRPGRRGQGA